MKRIDRTLREAARRSDALSALVLALFLGVTGNAGCAGDFDPAARVIDLRVLAVRADAPYATAGQTVHLEALVAEPAGRTLTWGWGLCVNPSYASATNCLQGLDPASIVIEQGKTTFDFTLPGDVITSLPSDGAPRASVGAVVVACPGDLSMQAGSIPFRCVDPATGRALETHEYVVGVKRVFARAVDKNENPVIEGITWDGADWPANEIKEVVACDEAGNDYDACAQEQKHGIRVGIPASSVEVGTDSFGIPYDEQVVVQYFSTEGIFEHEVSTVDKPESGWVARRSSAGRDVTMWFVVHDDRGGVTWEQRTVRVAPR
ncbi:MAG: hypothetical protein ABW133_06935 [Polyangiaceae bacterium]